MNNTLALGVFAALVYFRDLDWQFSAGESSTGRILKAILSYVDNYCYSSHRGDCDSSS